LKLETENRKPNAQKQYSILLLCLCFSACGYRFAGGDFPPDIKTLCITVFENRTAETGIETLFANDLLNEFTKSSLVLTGRAEADAVLAGEIESLAIKTVSRQGSHTALEREVRIAVALKLTDPDGVEIWSAKGISDNEAYPVTPDKSETEQNRRNAVSEISKRIAEDVYDRLTSDFR